ncbi:MAG: NAD(P)H-hydrate dehydratase [Acutalibacteraceae bacterium]|nr:NAD(P)H-hydrate dehydratase [Acutalibacteraceae bacterium]
MKVLTENNIRKVEETAAYGGMSFLDMMENAGRCVTEEICKRTDVKGKSVVIATGGGNNGGDGYVVARLLENEGAFCRVVSLSEPKTQTASIVKEKYGGEILPFNPSYFYEADIIVDAVFGIGFCREIEGVYKDAIEAVNESGAYKVSVDVPSGLNADSNTAKLCVKADLTVTFIGYKLCHLTYPAKEYCGEIVLCDIGINEAAYKEAEYLGEIIPPPVFDKRKSNTHKGSYGTAGLVVGSYSMAGAAILSVKGCLLSGVGLAKIVLPDSIYGIVTSSVPEAVCQVYFENEDVSSITEKLLDCPALLIGCGLSKGEFQKKLVKDILGKYKNKLIIDADGLNILSENIEYIKESKADIVLTPHPAEMARLCKANTDEIEANRIHYAVSLAKELDCTVVLKGAVTIVADKQGNMYFNLTGNAGMATGGSGDVLAGIIVSFAAQGMSCLQSAMSGVYVHGSAGDKAKEQVGEISLLPTHILSNLPEVYKELTR